ncbi:MAG: hypothetical protein A2431_04150 [Candidatus Zambryskibacteria bacterium RIFOXYC1_FULL_39_10]|uniref:Nudix hydrolase domain-containing protein n=1 Tax=Candidatus Zambryskibacteria bacterium RIFOXYC1_FULL_39_10 TaxID=1802779 RepID=A0A1G2UYZ9_9BACT|nr:MAG: hypothetical protein A2431_04150 [Candidatus Zambryskibacteria bacterium RIFOXYC1_FULL_39_10]OHB16664.1 MAG: hypothetical protein A2605_00710 [Candidatus Zambryskibacteria bacterium RIFOXYD1_FULL_39_35]
MSNTTSETVIRNGQEVKFIWHPGEILENVILHQVYGFLMTSNNLVVLVRDKEEKRFTLPGGKIENGETARNALIRECLEEAQIQLSNPVLLGSLEYINPNGKDDEDKHHQEIRYFSVVDNFKKFEPLKDGFETEERIFVYYEDLFNYIPWMGRSETGRAQFNDFIKMITKK